MLLGNPRISPTPQCYNPFMSFPTQTLVQRPLLDFPAAIIAAALTESFADYVVPMHFDAGSFERRFRSEHLDPAASRLWYEDEQLVGAVLIARRGWTTRLAAMAISVPFRNRGLGCQLLGTALEEARTRGEKEMVLEVIEGNDTALRFYERMGFKITRLLYGYECQPGTCYLNGNAEEIAEFDPLELARLSAMHGEPNLPWLLAAETLAAAAPPLQAWHLQNRAYALVQPDGDKNRLLAVLVPPQFRGQGWATRLVGALVARQPGQLWRAMPSLPEGLGTALFCRLGWQPMSIRQFEMSREL
jgi:ribosomal protein S18 acetylase RimI-like enzyme